MAALSLMAFAVTSAQAEILTDGGKAGLFRILGSSALVGTESFTGKLEKLNGSGPTHLLILEPGRNLTVLCGEIDVLEGKFLNEKEGLMRVLYLKCVALVFGKESEKIAGCKIVGEDITAQFLILAKKHEGEPYLLFEADPPSSTIGEIVYEGAECPLPSHNTIQGSMVGELKLGEPATQLLQFSEAISKLFQTSEGGDRINYGTFQLYLDASVLLELSGAHKGCGWGVV